MTLNIRSWNLFEIKSTPPPLPLQSALTNHPPPLLTPPPHPAPINPHHWNQPHQQGKGDAIGNPPKESIQYLWSWGNEERLSRNTQSQCRSDQTRSKNE